MGDRVDGFHAAGAIFGSLAGPWVPFDRALLTKREDCYQRVSGRFLARAQRDLHDFEASAPPIAFEPGSR